MDEKNPRGSGINAPYARGAQSAPKKRRSPLGDAFLPAGQSIDKVDALPSKASKQAFDGNINFL